MSGHSKWSTIKRKKAANDAARGKVFTKLIKEITVAARAGGGDEETNPRLRTAVQAARSANMPVANVDRAIKKGTGELPGVHYDEIVYEGYTPGGAALIIQCLTDNKNRTVADVRHLLSKHNGNLGETGSVSWNFERRGEIVIDATGMSEDDLMELSLEVGADDFSLEEGEGTLLCEPSSLQAVQSALEEKKIKIEEADLIMAPKTTIAIEGKAAEQTLKLMELLEDHDDVQKVYSNFDIDPDVMAAFEG
ncbi:MAG: YebC/PmpR family DNA-binding transcriptional regulator [Deferribacteres bacterium]|nr:YebC/PmpR family DNA-binding transcriptional regulator [candidate division KSB1 bacterium]MCB9502613.1 YebC/PmpR family DNA-binding transcriptional regulator [Deferribacteres bacterium]